ncbi:hypothetical protein BH23GEM9_BH23GEM9_05550 [soil metagenome]
MDLTQQQKLILSVAAAAVIAFAVGALWQYNSARGYARDLDATRHDLAFQSLEATLGAATIEAQRGSYELARQLASSFFGGLQSELENARPDMQAAFTEILQRRDAMITSLSRSDPQAGSMLAQLFMRYRIAMGEPVGPDVDLSPPPAVGPDGAPSDTGPTPGPGTP